MMQREQHRTCSCRRRVGQLLAIGLIFLLSAGCAGQQTAQQTDSGQREQANQAQAANPPAGGAQDKQAAQLFGHMEALQAGCDAAGVKRENVEDFSVELDQDDGRQSYEVELVYDGVEYEYELDAVSGAVLRQKQEQYRLSRVEQQAERTYQQALEIALQEGQLSAKTVEVRKNHLHEEDGRPAYAVVLASDGQEFAYQIDAKTGAVLEAAQSKAQAVDQAAGGAGDGAAADIGAAQAKAIALQHAGVAESDASDWSVEADHHRGQLVYEVEFEVGKTEYEYEIDGASGEIRRAERD